MLPQFNVQIDDANASDFEARLKSLTVNGVAISYVRKGGGFFSVSLGQPNLTDFRIALDGKQVSPTSLGIANVEIKDKSGTTAYHIPQGTLLIYDASMRPSENTVQASTLDIAPYILNNYAVKIPTYMQGSVALL
jgi:hypothetical protein